MTAAFIRRIVLTSTAVVMFLILAGATYQGAATALERRQFPHPGRLVEIGGRQLHIYCAGEGSPTVVLEAPAAGMSAAWGWVQPAVAKSTRVCSYDRAGLGWSEAGDSQYDPSVGATAPALSARAIRRTATICARRPRPRRSVCQDVRVPVWRRHTVAGARRSADGGHRRLRNDDAPCTGVAMAGPSGHSARYAPARGQRRRSSGSVGRTDDGLSEPPGSPDTGCQRAGALGRRGPPRDRVPAQA